MNNAILFLSTFFLGTFIGSFLNVVVDRIPQKRSLLWGRSVCDECNRTLRFYDLVPLISYALLQGKCRSCKKRIPVRLFFVELLTGLLWMSLIILVSLGYFSVQEFVYLVIVFSIFLAILFTDIIYGIIPDQLNLLLLGIISLYLFYYQNTTLLHHILSALGMGFVFLFLFIATKGRGMGFGDVKFSFVLGLFLGFPLIVIGFYIAFLTGAVISLILVLYGKKSFKNGTIPFGPFLVFAGYFAYLFGTPITTYFSRFF